MLYIYSSHYSDHYIVSVSWINSTAVSAIWMNRNQNLSVVVHCMQQNHWKCHEVCTFNRTILISFNYLSLVLLYPCNCNNDDTLFCTSFIELYMTLSRRYQYTLKSNYNVNITHKRMCVRRNQIV